MDSPVTPRQESFAWPALAQAELAEPGVVPVAVDAAWLSLQRALGLRPMPLREAAALGIPPARREGKPRG